MASKVSNNLQGRIVPLLLTTYTLIVRLASFMKETASSEKSPILDVWDCALQNDFAQAWNPFLATAFGTSSYVSSFMSEVTGYSKDHVNSIEFGAFSRFMAESLLAILDVISDTTLVWDMRRWQLYYSHSKVFRPPISIFIIERDGNQTRQLRTMSTDQKESDFWQNHYVFTSILDQKVKSPKWQCPSAIIGSSNCKRYRDSICNIEFDSFDLPSRLRSTNCPLSSDLKSFKEHWYSQTSES